MLSPDNAELLEALDAFENASYSYGSLVRTSLRRPELDLKNMLRDSALRKITAFRTAVNLVVVKRPE